MARLILSIGALVPAVGLSINLLFPPEHYGYLTEQILLLLFALAALFLCRVSSNAAIFLWCASVQLPILAMIEYSYLHTGDWSVFILAPWLGLLITSFFTKSTVFTVVFAFIATSINCGIGILCNSIAQTGALCAFTLVSSALLFAWCRTEAQKQAAIKKVEIIERGLNSLLEAYDGSTNS